MFKTAKQKMLLGIYVFLVLSIPIGAYLASQEQTTKGRAASEQTSRKIEGALNSTNQTTSAQQEIKNLLASSSAIPSPTPTPTTAVSFGPTLSFKLILEGRPADNQASKVFVGISLGTTTGAQQAYLLSFTLDLPSSGEYAGLSLAGLEANKQYTAFIKSTAQIATSSAFIMSPSTTNLNAGQPLTLLTGDLNEDNVINVADYNIAKSAYGSKPGGEKWNEAADFNKDLLVNNSDLAYITKNMDKSGSSGVWVSPVPLTGGPPNVGGATTGPDGTKGYWLWVPQ